MMSKPTVGSQWAHSGLKKAPKMSPKQIGCKFPNNYETHLRLAIVYANSKKKNNTFFKFALNKMK